MRASFIIRQLIMIIDSRASRTRRSIDDIRQRARQTNVDSVSKSRGFIVTLFFFYWRYLWRDAALCWVMEFIDNFIIRGWKRRRWGRFCCVCMIFTQVCYVAWDAIEFTSVHSWPQRNVLQYITTKHDALADER